MSLRQTDDHVTAQPASPPAGSSEICGDGPMAIADRIRYLGINLARNLRGIHSAPAAKSFCVSRTARTPRLVSPSRAMTEAFLFQRLRELMPKREIRVLDVGCGNGALARILAEIGFSGSYTGIDIQDNFDRGDVPAFIKQFHAIDAHCFEPVEKFDVIISISALEHIPDDMSLIARLKSYVADDGVQLHFVPGAWALPTYLWHGYRQYTTTSITERFGPDRTTIFTLGGLISTLLHLAVITSWEIPFRVSLRKAFPALYGHLLDGSLAMDKMLPFCGNFHAVVWRNSIDPRT